MKGNAARGASDVDMRKAGEYESAIGIAWRLMGDLEVARSRGDVPAQLRLLHEQIDAELGRAGAAATAMHAALLAAGGNSLRAGVDPEVKLWKRRMNTALNLRSQQKLAESDDAGTLPAAGARVQTRAAFGPHQAGMDFADEPHYEPRREPHQLDLEAVLDRRVPGSSA